MKIEYRPLIDYSKPPVKPHWVKRYGPALAYVALNIALIAVFVYKLADRGAI